MSLTVSEEWMGSGVGEIVEGTGGGQRVGIGIGWDRYVKWKKEIVFFVSFLYKIRKRKKKNP